jgi:hypothetical protein
LAWLKSLFFGKTKIEETELSQRMEKQDTTPSTTGSTLVKWVWQYSVHMQSFITILLVV